MVPRQLGRQGRLYAGLHTAYGDTPVPASADAVRHIQFLTSHDPTSKRNSPEKKSSPGQVVRFTGRETAGLRQLTCLVRPSGTLNTLPEASEIFEAAFGSKSNITLSTTVTAGTGAVGGATLASATGIVAGTTFVLITCPDGRKRARRILTSPGGGVVTWAPNLPAGQSPADSAAVKAGLTYRLTTPNALSLWFAHYLLKTDNTTAGLQRLLRGVTLDRFSLAFDANEEPQFTASGPGQTQLTGGSVPTKPGAFTTVGGNPPSGIVGEGYIGNDLYDFTKLGIELVNNTIVRNDEYGYSQARDAYRRGRLDVSVALDAFAEDESKIYDPAEAGTPNLAVFVQTGLTEGNIIVVAAPQVEYKVPDTDDPDEEVNWPFKGMALESADDANDQLFFALL